MDKCPLCQSDIEAIDGACRELKLNPGEERFFRCATCGSVSVPERFHLDCDEERERYGTHNNQSENEGYQQYLSGVSALVESEVPDFTSMKILDYGSGENAVLTSLLQERNIDASAYDPNYNSLSKLDGIFDIVIACESVEHFRNPLEEFKKINKHLKSGGYIWIRTEHLETTPYFSAWWYKNDPTHIFFYSEKTMNWIADYFEFDLVLYDDKFVTLFKKR